MIDVQVNNQKVRMEVDTGAAVSVISMENYEKVGIGSLESFLCPLAYM